MFRSCQFGAAPPDQASRPILLETAKIENKEIGYYSNGKYGARFREEGAIPDLIAVT